MRRRRWAGAVALAAVTLLLAACGATPASPAPAGGLPASVEHNGNTVPYLGLQRWTLASAPSRDSTRLTVFAIGSDDGGNACGPPILRLHAAESATTIRVSVAQYQRAAQPMTACSAIGYLPSPQTVVLQHAIGNRTVVDAASGTTQTLLVASEYPGLVPPAGLVATPIRRFPDSTQVTRSWTDHGDLALSVDTQTPAAAREIAPSGRIVQRFDVHGTPAALFDAGSGQTEIQWIPNDHQAITVRFSETAHRRWSVAQRIAIARSVTNYTTDHAGRLPLPSTPGTAVAQYSSADGPVRHAEQMWKSSGIWVGVRCVGVGTVTVSIRGTDHPFTCAAGAGEHLARSEGKPNDPFFVDIGATKGVRWSVVLARASLDGS